MFQKKLCLIYPILVSGLSRAAGYELTIYLSIKAKTTTEKFAQMVRVNFKRILRLKMSIPNIVEAQEYDGHYVIKINRRKPRIH